jgi:hypothetical protein
LAHIEKKRSLHNRVLDPTALNDRSGMMLLAILPADAALEKSAASAAEETLVEVVGFLPHSALNCATQESFGKQYARPTKLVKKWVKSPILCII